MKRSEFLRPAGGLQIVQGFLEATGVGFFGFGERLEPVGDFGEPFVARGLGHPRVHVGVFKSFPMNGGFEVGRPPGIPKGQDQRMQLALGFQLAVKDSGTIVIVASVDGAELKRTVFNIVGPPVKDTKAA